MHLNFIAAFIAVGITSLIASATPIAKLNAIEHPMERRAAILENMVSQFFTRANTFC